MRKLLQKLLSGFVIKMANKYASRPKKERVHEALTKLYSEIVKNPGKRGLLFNFDENDKYIVFSDQHKGARNYADDFGFAANNYITALSYYNQNQYTFISLGDSEELWENTLEAVKTHNKETFAIESLFLQRNAFVKVFGNHDLYWDNDPLAGYQLEKIYGQKVKIYEGLILQTRLNDKPLAIFLTHGHQGDLASDGNWFSKWFVSRIWAPLQAYLHINPNTPAFNNQLKSTHNQFMYEWAAAQQSVLVTGHTHQPVFNSLTHLERIYIRLDDARKTKNKVEEDQLLDQMRKERIMGATVPPFSAYKPNYFNTGCCCFSDGDITGLEIIGGKIKLIKWAYQENKQSSRIVLEETDLVNLQSEV
ncbi:metallophosphoesterase [Pedobacter polaris]|uniref:Metallophosphoesterase n=1 Tax=Pedobacter polaris TaxID=2571273 RepID=A0A4U1CUZ0_9SPHI|nr:metallophosphoesterase [Pedobacter polaris]TKC12714.1 metallophosphoesterase [Pedobacter polaris]